MLHSVAKVLRNSLASLTWVERFGGLVVSATRTIYGKTDDGGQVAIGTETWPVGCGVSLDACFTANGYTFFAPDAKLAAVAFFVDDGGASLVKMEGAKDGFAVFSFNLRLLVWLNGKRLNDDACGLSGRAAPYVMAQLLGSHNILLAFPSPAIERNILKSVTVQKVRQLPKSPTNFAPFSFSEQFDKGYFLAPFDYFAIGIQGEFVIAPKCLPEYLAPNIPPFVDNFCF